MQYFLLVIHTPSYISAFITLYWVRICCKLYLSLSSKDLTFLLLLFLFSSLMCFTCFLLCIFFSTSIMQYPFILFLQHLHFLIRYVHNHASPFTFFIFFHRVTFLIWFCPLSQFPICLCFQHVTIKEDMYIYNLYNIITCVYNYNT